VIESTVPFRLTVRVHSTLGEFLGRREMELGAREFEALEAAPEPEAKRLTLRWNGVSESGQRAGTGAYIFLWRMTLFPKDGPPREVTGKNVLGLLRIR
jgi:hypothetical protein